jgi:Fe-S oxidoreductase
MSPARAKKVAALKPLWIDEGYEIVALVPSCALMLKFEWPLILPDDPDVEARWPKHTSDLSEYIVDIAKKEGLAPGLGRSRAASRSISPATRAPRTWARRRPSCCA